MNRGILYAAGAYTLWGLLPIFWKALHGVPALEILTHRMVWSLVFVLLILAVRRQWGWVRPTLRHRRSLLTFTATAALLSLNWFIYIWAVNAGFIVETSLGYFINPLVNVLLGMLFLGERLRGGQKAAIALAVAGVAYLTVSYGTLPWIALTLAFSFGLYGLLRKTAPLASLEGMALETLIFAPFALAYLLFLQGDGRGAFGHVDAGTTALLAFSGVVTALPLLLFGKAARQITLTSLGIMQYIAPTLQFLIGVFLFGETLSLSRLVGFVLIWIALALYTGESLLRSRRTPRLQTA